MPYSIASPIVRLPEFAQFSDDDDKNIRSGGASLISEPFIAVNNSTAKPGLLSGVKSYLRNSNQQEDKDEAYELKELKEIKIGEKPSSPERNSRVIKNGCSPKKKTLFYSSLGAVGVLASLSMVVGIRSYKTRTAVDDNKVLNNLPTYQPEKNYTGSLDEILAALKCSEYTTDDKKIRLTSIPVTEGHPKITVNDVHSMAYSGQINQKSTSYNKNSVNKNELGDKIKNNGKTIKEGDLVIDKQASCLYRKIDVLMLYPGWERKHLNKIMHEVELLSHNIERHLNKEGDSVESAQAHKKKINTLNNHVLNFRHLLQENVRGRFDISNEAWDSNKSMSPLAKLNAKLYEINDSIDDYIFAKKTDAEVSKKYQAVNNIIRSSERGERLAELENATQELKIYITKNSSGENIEPESRNEQLKILSNIEVILAGWNNKISKEQEFYSHLVDYFYGRESGQSKKMKIVNSMHNISDCIRHLDLNPPSEVKNN